MLDFTPPQVQALGMATPTDPSPDLDAAYGLHSPSDSVRLYRAWAASYDSGFAQRTGYLLPGHVAGAFVEAGGQGPVLDVGAGTGLLAARLADFSVGPVDGVDISAEMLTEAIAKSVYRQTFLADLTAPLPMADSGYCGIVSSGTFTQGHVGPAAFDELLRIAAPGAVFALSINVAVFKPCGFADKLDALREQICRVTLAEAPIYAAPDPDHAADRAMILCFTKR